MMSLRPWQVLTLGIAVAATPLCWASRSHRSATAGRLIHHSHRVHHVRHVLQGQRQIDEDRTRQIQTALIREHYLTGEPSGQWDATTQAAMQKYQADHGWQTRLMPDSRALIKLGLGPKDDEGTQTADTQPAGPAQPSISYSDTLAAAHSIQN
jgi:Putative peptidoglycan binding domain